ncbi:MAG: hypothetical protein ACKV19_29135 [Verrucomicrobiales bacterium]
MRPLWRDLIQSVWATDPLQCPCCGGTLRRIETISRAEIGEFFLLLNGLWEALVNIPPPSHDARIRSQRAPPKGNSRQKRHARDISRFAQRRAARQTAIDEDFR